jgi:hypothetical protein
MYPSYRWLIVVDNFSRYRTLQSQSSYSAKNFQHSLEPTFSERELAATARYAAQLNDMFLGFNGRFDVYTKSENNFRV